MSKDQMVGKSEDHVNQNSEGLKRRDLLLSGSSLVAASALMGAGVATPAHAQLPARTPPSGQRPNIVVIMGDDIGWDNIGAYHQGLMYSTTPNLDKMASEGMRFTDYYAEPSCTAGRANFITGELPIRTGLTTVGQAGATVGMPDEAPTIATALKAMGYATGQFGKNHLGDLNRYLPTVHGFDEFFGYLYHLDAMEDPFWHSYPPALKDYGRTAQPAPQLRHRRPTIRRWSRAGARSASRGSRTRGRCRRIPTPGIKYNMETIDEDILDYSMKFIDKAKADGKPFFLWMNPTRAHVISHLSPKYQAKLTPENGWYLEEGVMSQLDDVVGGLMDKLKADGLDDNTIVVFTTDNGTENFTWPDGGNTPFAAGKGTIMEGGMRVPMIVRWPGHIPAGKVENGIMSGLDFFPTLVAAAGDPNIKDELLNGQAARRHDLQGSSRRLQSVGPADRQGAVQPPRDLLLRRRHAGRGSHRRLEVQVDRPTRRLGRRNGQARLADPVTISGSIRSSGCSSEGQHGILRLLLQISSSTSSGASSSCSRRSPNTLRPSSNSRRCRRARASISKRSRPKSKSG